MKNVKLNFAHVCENVIISEDKKLSVINIFNQIKASDFPAVHAKLSIVSSVSGGKGNYFETIEIVNEKNGDDVIARAENKEVYIGEENGVTNFIANFTNLLFSSEGRYKIRIKIDGVILSEDNFILVTKL